MQQENFAFYKIIIYISIIPYYICIISENLLLYKIIQHRIITSISYVKEKKLSHAMI